MSQDSAPVPGVDRPNITVLDVIRAIVLVVAIGTLALWGFGTWPAPWNFILGIGAPVVLLLIWALFLSPKAVLTLHPFLRAAVELLIYVGVTIAWWQMDQPIIGLGFGIVAVGAGLVSGRRALS